MKYKYSFVLVILFYVVTVSSVNAQMTNWQMDNFKKNEKNRKKRAKTKGPKINTKGRSHKAGRSFRGGKSLFSKKRYDVGYIPANSYNYCAFKKGDLVEEVKQKVLSNNGYTSCSSYTHCF